MPTIKIPTPLREMTDEQNEVQVEGSTVEESLRALTEQHEELKEHLYDEDGESVRQFVNIYVNETDIRTKSNEQTSVDSGDVISIVPAIAGGTNRSEQTRKSTNNHPEEFLENVDETTFSKEEVERYSRHFLLPEVGEEGQKKLKSGKVLMVGAGGLGAPFSMYLAAAGVGKLGIVDFDTVEHSNLQRQLLYGSDDVDRPKLEAAGERLRDINPNVEIETYETRLTRENALDIIEPYDVVVDGTDNFPTRYLVNDACVFLGKPNVYGSIFRFEGQASVFYGEEGPCYRCLYEEPPPPGLVPDCAEGGVLGVLPGIIGTIQAMETIKLLLDQGSPLIGRYLLFDAMDMEFRELKLPKNPDCPVCSDDPEITELINYEQFCGIEEEEEQQSSSSQENLPDMEVKTLKNRLEEEDSPFVLDVRNPQEVEICRLEESEVIPLSELQDKMEYLPEDREIVVHCRSGQRSKMAQEMLVEEGFSDVKNLKGGILAWAHEIDSSMPVY